MSRYHAILIAGPTASGKSAVALELADRLDGVIINADSMQVYAELRVLSARPSPDDEASVPHALYGVVPAAQAYSVGRWLDDVKQAIAEAGRVGRMPIITGGTGLYFKALLEGLSPIPEIPVEIRKKWRSLAQEKDAGRLYKMLRERDSEMAARLQPTDPQRVVRALEVHDATGRSLAQWQREPGKPLFSEKQVRRIYIEPPRAALYGRINSRFEMMLDAGALEEVKTLADKGLNPELPAMRALGVKPLMAYLNGDIERTDAIDRSTTDTRRYAKRQLTWAKSNMIAWNHIFEQESKRLTANIMSFIDL